MKTVLITGISRGIGKAVAQKFLNEGYFVIGTSMTGEVDFAHENLKVVQLDLTKSDSISACVSSVGNIDILINNAGVLLDGEETIVITDLLRKTLEVNLIGTIDFTEKLVSKINNGGHIVNISSSAGSLAEIETESHAKGYYPAYKISKASLNMYARTIAMRLKDIKVSSVNPGWVKTEMGGEDAPITPVEAAEHIFKIATDANIETGQFWFKGEKYKW